jgi:hypothetical protein
MKETQHSADPSSKRESQAFKQNYAGTFVARRQQTQDNPVKPDEDTTDSKSEPTPLEVIMKVWSFITEPKHANAIMAVFTALIFLATGAYAIIALLQWKTMGGQLDIAQKSLITTQRPWVKIKHRIVKPLTFNVPGNNGLIDSMTLEDTLENVGQSVALNVFNWEDVIPIDEDSSLRTARARQDQWCNASRYRDTSQLSGYMLFPKDPFIQNMGVGGYMDNVNKIAKINKIVPGKVGFVLVGCVCYRSSLEPASAPFHKTKFIYYLAIPQEGGGVLPYVTPAGVAGDLRLIVFPDGFSAD